MPKIVNGVRVKSGGRTKGARNKRTLAVLDAQAEAERQLNALFPDGFTGDALTLLQAVYKNTGLAMSLRLEAAKQAIRFETPALSSVDSKLSGEVGTYVAVAVAERDAVAFVGVAADLATIA